MDKAGVRDLLRSSEVGEAVAEKARGLAAGLPPGYSVNTYVGRNRVNAEIRADTDEAWRDNLKNNTLERLVT